MSLPFINGRGAYSITAVRTYVPYVPNIGSRSLSFEKISLLDSYYINRYIIINYRSSSNLGKINLLLCKLWPLSTILFGKYGFRSYLLKILVCWIHIIYTCI